MATIIPYINPIRLRPRSTTIDYTNNLPRFDLMTQREQYQRGVYPANYYPQFIIGEEIQILVFDDVNVTIYQLYNATTGTTICTLRTCNKWMNLASFSPDDQCVATVSSDRFDNIVQLWDATDGAEICTPSGLSKFASFSPDSQRLATGFEDGTARIWDIGTSLPLQETVLWAEIYLN